MGVGAVEFARGLWARGERYRPLVVEVARYGLVSVAALALDYGVLFLLKTGLGVHYLIASAISYCTGAVLQYFLSVALVFSERRISNRGHEFAAFVAIGLLGLAVTQAVIALTVGGFGMNYLLGKAIAVGASFIVNYAARRTMLFTAKQAVS